MYPYRQRRSQHSQWFNNPHQYPCRVSAFFTFKEKKKGIKKKDISTIYNYLIKVKKKIT